MNSFSFPISPLNLGGVLTFVERVIVMLTGSFIVISPSLSSSSSGVLTSTGSGFLDLEASSSRERTFREPLVLLVSDILIEFGGLVLKV